MKFDKEFLHGIMSEKESSISVRSRFLKSNKKTNREKNRKLTMISFLPAIIWLILLLVLSSQNGPQTAATSLPMAEWIQQHFFPQDSVDYVHMYLRKWGTLYRLFHRIRIIGSGNEECDESLESGVCGIRTLYDPGNCR